MRSIATSVLLTAMLVSCAPVPQGPTVAVMPSTSKSFSVFQDDNVVCKHYAAAEVSGGQKSDTNMQVGIAMVSTLLGAGLGGIIDGGRGALIGAGAGAVGGTGIGAVKASKDGTNLQDRYDIAFSQCMTARGNQVPTRGTKS